MAYTPTTFTDRAVQYPGRRVLTPVSGQANTVDVTRAEGTEFTIGTKLDAANLNAEFTKIKNETNLLASNMLLARKLDYANKVALSIGTYTPTKDGVISGVFSNNATNGAGLYIDCNSVRIFQEQVANTYAHTIPQTIVNSGEALTIGSSGGTNTLTAYFIPFKY